MTIELHSAAAADTRAIAAAIAGVLAPGDVVVLDGGLGAGKTTFTQSAVRALGSDAPVTSPTFAIVQHYRGAPMPIAHVDAYRLSDVQELYDIGFDELLDGTTVLFVEWGERVGPALPHDRLTVTIDMDLDAPDAPDAPDDHVARVVRVDTAGPTWAERAGALRDALAAVTGGQ